MRDLTALTQVARLLEERTVEAFATDDLRMLESLSGQCRRRVWVPCISRSGLEAKSGKALVARFRAVSRDRQEACFPAALRIELSLGAHPISLVLDVTGHPRVSLQGERAVERRSGSVRILFGGDGVGFDAWVPANEVDVQRYGYGSSGGSSSCGGSGARSRQVTVKTESAVLLGPKHELLDDAVFEVGALMEITDETDDLYQVQVPEHEIDAPDGMWISKRAVENRGTQSAKPRR